MVLGGEARDVRLVERHRRHPELTGRERARPAEDERAGQVDDVRLELGKRRGDGGGGHADGQGIHQRDHHGGHADDVEAEVVRDLVLEVARAGGDHHGLVPFALEVLEHAQHRIGHSVDVGQERLRHDSHSHIRHSPTAIQICRQFWLNQT